MCGDFAAMVVAAVVVVMVCACVGKEGGAGTNDNSKRAGAGARTCGGSCSVQTAGAPTHRHTGRGIGTEKGGEEKKERGLRGRALAGRGPACSAHLTRFQKFKTLGSIQSATKK